MYVVVLAGGGGTRLRPLSRPDRPKPFLPLLGPETLFQRTIARVRELAPADLHVVVEPRHERLARQQAPDVHVLVEPEARNTTAAIALAAGAIERRASDVMAVLPADHWIEDEARFRDVLRAAERELTGTFLGIDAPLVTLGVRVTRPATEYGYLVPDVARGHSGAIGGAVLARFKEKPEREEAERLAATPGVAWNAGMFLWQRAAVLDALRRYAPAAARIADAATDRERNDAYGSVEPISIDRAVMEPAAADGRVVMGSLDVGWSDLGSWTALLDAIAGASRASGRVVEPGEPAALGPDDLFVAPRDGRLDVLVGPRDTIVAQAPSALLTGARVQEAAVRALLERVAAQEGQP